MSALVYIHETDTFPYRPIHWIWMIVCSLFAFIVFYIIDRTVKSHSNVSSQADVAATWLRHNTLLSFIHSCICSVLLIISVLHAPEMLDDPISHINFFNYALIAFSVGYFLWDFFDCLHNSTSSIFAILIHHVIVLSFLVNILLRTRYIGYGLHALSLEINSVFLHARRLLRWYSPFSLSVNGQRLLKITIDTGNYLTFVVFRFAVVINGLYVGFVQKHRFNPTLHFFMIICVAAIGILNLVLFYRLVKNQCYPKKKKKTFKRETSLEDMILMTDNHVLIPSWLTRTNKEWFADAFLVGQRDLSCTLTDHRASMLDEKSIGKVDSKDGPR